MWSPPDSRPYTYAVVIYDVDSIRFINVGSATSVVVCNLVCHRTYLVFVVAMLGDEYSASYQAYTVEGM